MDERFHSKVDRRGPDECWLWTASLNSHGYGQFMLRDTKGKWRPHQAHRLALQEVEPIPFVGAHALHSCDNPRCCNPAHLRWGTAKDNAKDVMTRGRGFKGEARSRVMKLVAPRGERHCNAVLDAARVRAIRADSRGHKTIAAEFGISASNVSAIKLRRSWAHITD